MASAILSTPLVSPRLCYLADYLGESSAMLCYVADFFGESSAMGGYFVDFGGEPSAFSSSLLASPRLSHWVCLVTWASQCETAHQEEGRGCMLAMGRIVVGAMSAANMSLASAILSTPCASPWLWVGY